MEEKYGVIICNKCLKAKIIEMHKMTTTCPHCNKKHRIKNIKIHFRTNDQQEARKFIGLINAKYNNKQSFF